MKPFALLSAAAVVAATLSPIAHADSFSLGVRDDNVAIGVHLGDPVIGYVPSPYYAPRYYAPAPRYYAPPVAVYPSGYWAPRPYYREYHEHWDRDRYYGRDRDEWRHRRWRDDDRWRDDGHWHRHDR